MGITNAFAGCVHVVQQKTMGQYLLQIYLFLYDRLITGMVLSPTTIQCSIITRRRYHFNTELLFK